MVDRPSEKTDSILIKQNRGSDGSPAAVLFYAAVLAVSTQKRTARTGGRTQVPDCRFHAAGRAIRGEFHFKQLRWLQQKKSALPRLETRVAFADNVDLAPAAHDLAVAVALFGGFQGR